MIHLLTAVILVLPQQAPAAVEVEAALKAVVARFFETQQSEDAEGYLALWSAKANRPRPEQLKFIFESGDDTFSDIAITRAIVSGDEARVRVAASRSRTDLRAKNPDGTTRVFRTTLQLALALRREDGSWKLVREGPPSDELAAALIETDDPAARKVLIESDPELVNIRLVESLARRADSLAQIPQYTAAQAIYERALEVARIIGDRKAEGQAIQNIANTRYYQRDFPGALKLYEQRLGIERDIANDEGIANALLGIGTIQYSTYDYGAALQAYRSALAIQERLNDDVLVGTTLISTGNVLYLQGDFEGAIADYRRAEALKRKNNDFAGALTALEGLGRVYFAQGDYAAALGAFNGVLAEWRKRNAGVRQALVLQSIGDIHFRLGNTDQARVSFAESRKLFDAAKDTGNAGRVLQGAALNELVAGRFPEGEKAYTESISLCTGASDPECIARAQVGLAFALAAQQKFDDAITWYGRSLISFNDLNMEDPAARARVGLAEAFYGKGAFEKALEQAVNARRTGVALASDDLLWRALVSQARAERKLGKPVEALGTARAALLAVRRMAAAALDRPDHAVPHDTTAAYATLAVLQAEVGDGAGVFATAEEMRAHALRISLASNERDIARGMTAEERDAERLLASELVTLLVKRDRQKELPKPDAALIAKLDAAILEMTARRTAARQKLFERLPDLQTWRGLGGPATSDDLPLLLDSADKVLLEFIVDEHDTVVVLATGANGGDATIQVSAYAVPIERQTLAQRVARALDGHALGGIEAWRKGSAELFQLLPDAVLERLVRAQSIVVSPDDVLWRVPFEAMPVGTQYLADRATVTYTQSVAAAVDLPPAAPADPKVPVVAVHSPQLSAALLETLKATAPTWIVRSSETASAEVDRITHVTSEPAAESEPVEPVVLSGTEASLERLKGLTSYGALHIGAPFRVNSASPLFSPILLAAPAAPMKEADGIAALEARHVFNIDPLGSVVLFSDPAALSKRDAAAAAGIIRWAWRASDATTVIFKRWGGDDPAAADVIGRFYRELRAGKSATEALHTARAAVRATEAGRAPAAWAGWLIFTGR